jgi:uncharacterized protein (TIGR03086 family)
VEHVSKAYEATAAALVAVTDWSAPSPCTDWTVGEVRDHLIEAHHAFASAIDGGPPTGAADFAVATERCLAALNRPGALTEEHPFPFGPTSGETIALISLSETVVHGWDVAEGAGVAYTPPPDAVALLLADSSPPPDGLFAAPLPVPADASPLVTLLARLGRKA